VARAVVLEVRLVGQPFASTAWTEETRSRPRPTTAATRFVEPGQRSPTANTRADDEIDRTPVGPVGEPERVRDRARCRAPQHRTVGAVAARVQNPAVFDVLHLAVPD
jgi:hypothetical protein